MNESEGRVDTFANRLRMAMAIRCVKKSELSRQTGISQQRMGQYARGRYEAKQSAVYVLAEALKVDPAWLMGYDLPMERRIVSPSKKRMHEISGKDLKLALFGDAGVSDALLEDVKKAAAERLDLFRKKQNQL